MRADNEDDVSPIYMHDPWRPSMCQVVTTFMSRVCYAMGALVASYVAAASDPTLIWKILSPVFTVCGGLLEGIHSIIAELESKNYQRYVDNRERRQQDRDYRSISRHRQAQQ